MQTVRQDRLKKIFDEVARGSNLDHALSLIAHQVAVDLGAPTCKIWVVKRGDICEQCPLAQICTNRQMCMHLAAASGASLEKEYPRVPLSVFTASLIARGGTEDFTDPNSAGELLFGLQHGAHNESGDSYALYPLRGASGTVGLIGVFNHRQIERAELHSLEQFAPVAVMAIRVAELQSKCNLLRTRLEKEAEAAAAAGQSATQREGELETAVAQLTRQVAQLQTQFKRLQTEYDTLLNKSGQAGHRAERLEAENQQLRARAESILATQQESGRSYSETVGQLESERHRVEEENAWLKGRLTSLEQNVADLSKLREVLMNELTERGRLIEALKAELETAQAESATARESLSNLEQRASLLDRENADLRERASSSTTSAETLQHSLRLAEDARAQLEQGRLELEEKVSALSAEAKNLGLENNRVSDENERLAIEAERLRAEVIELRENNGRLNEESERLALLNKEHTNARVAAQSRATELEQENAALNQANAELENAVERLQALVTRLEENSLKLRDRAESADRERAELEHRNRALVEQNRSLSLESRSKARFLASMSHELRTPMNAIIGFTSLLLDDRALQLSERHRRSLERVSRNARDLLELINNVLDLSKIEANRMDVYCEPAEARDLIERAISVVEPLILAKPVKLSLEIQEGLPAMRTDRAKLQQILINLLSNAIKFTQEGEVKVTAKRAAPDRISIAVSDTGIGIAESDLPKIFDEFWQASNPGRTARAGTGLGLAITRRLAALLEGEIAVSSRPGEGSVFTLTLPAEIEGRVAAAIEAEAAPADPERTALVIDSDPASLYLTKKYLAEAGYSVAATDDPARGVEIALKAKPAVITVDIDLPGGGIDVIEQITRGENASELIAISTDAEAEQRAKSAGAKAFLRKPIEREQLNQLLKRAGASAPGRVLIVDDDPDALDLVVAMIEGAGYEIRTATGGREALEELARARPDVIILDLMLPEMDGFEIVHRLSLNPDWRAIPVVLLTARDLSHEERRALDIGTVRIIQKGGFSRDELLAEIRVIAGESESAEARQRGV